MFMPDKDDMMKTSVYVPSSLMRKFKREVLLRKEKLNLSEFLRDKMKEYIEEGD